MAARFDFPLVLSNQAIGCCCFSRRRRRQAPIPATHAPIPNNAREEGSGTAVEPIDGPSILNELILVCSTVLPIPTSRLMAAVRSNVAVVTVGPSLPSGRIALKLGPLDAKLNSPPVVNDEPTLKDEL